MMDAGLQKRLSLGPLLVAVIAVCLAIVATVLLANDGKHLNSLLVYLNLTPAAPPVEPPARMKTVKRQKPGVKTIHLPPHLLKFEPVGERASFARSFTVSGKDLCDRFTAEGFSNPQGWHTSPVNSGGFECMADLAEGNATDPAGKASLFLDIRGEASGDIRSIRMKAVAPDTPAGNIIRAKLEAALAQIVKQTRWTDLSAMIEPAGRMQPYQAQHFGISVSIKPEPSAPDRLNVILLTADQPPGLKLTRGFFDGDRWLRPAALSDRPVLYSSTQKNRMP